MTSSPPRRVPPTNLTLITGPSRTADIELTLAIGVHGPKQLDIIVVTGSEKGDREAARKTV